ncbi:MAG TPA: hypothetical protein VMX94_00920 [Armatimonadota bacterium]|nr:hypothetical protein [Armatimonadota bacterium]
MQNMIIRLASVIAMVFLCGMPSAICKEPGYTPKIPPGYRSQVVLHVDYGTTPDKIRMLLPERGEHYDHLSVSGLRVMGDKFYFIDDTVHTIKRYLSPGTFVWETEPLLNLHYFDVAPDGKVYAAWGTMVDRLSCIDGAGKLLWTIGYTDILSKEKVKELGLHESYGNFGWVDWTVHGLSIALNGLDEENNPKSVAVLLDKDGRFVRGLPGSVVGSDGTIYSYDIGKGRERFPSLRIIAKDLHGKALREILPDFGAGKGVCPAGNPGFSRMRFDPTGAFAVRGTPLLATRIPLTSFLQGSKLEEILWRFGPHGNLTEEWRFLGSQFASRHPGIVMAPDGCVYHLNFGEKGIDVVKYSRPGKGGKP